MLLEEVKELSGALWFLKRLLRSDQDIELRMWILHSGRISSPLCAIYFIGIGFIKVCVFRSCFTHDYWYRV